MSTAYFASSKRDPALLLRRTTDDAGVVDEAYLDGRWAPTKVIVDFLFGHNDFVEPISAEQAQALEPAAV